MYDVNSSVSMSAIYNNALSSPALSELENVNERLSYNNECSHDICVAISMIAFESKFCRRIKTREKRKNEKWQFIVNTKAHRVANTFPFFPPARHFWLLGLVSIFHWQPSVETENNYSGMS